MIVAHHYLLGSYLLFCELCLTRRTTSFLDLWTYIMGDQRCHSVKVPRLYKVASKIVREVKENNGSPKGLVYEKPHPNVKALYALVQETLKHSAILDILFKETKFLEKEYRVNPWLPAVLVTELLWGKKTLPGNSKPVKSVLRYRTAFQKALYEYNFQICKHHIVIPEIGYPRAVRVNTLVVSIDEAVKHFIFNGWVHVQEKPNSYEQYLNVVKHLRCSEFISDFHLKDLFIFAPKTNLIEDELYKCGGIFLQSKASCMASFLLNPKPGSIVMDMCAAPGMKTSHLAALMKDTGVLYAMEKDKKRFSTLESIVKKSRATCIKVECNDALKVSSTTHPDVEYILVDPTCSGSGAHGNLDIPSHQIKKLMGFQSKILRHALVDFPAAKRIVYSTCSMKPEENEQVVQNVLNSVQDFEVKDVLQNSWINRGSSNYFGGSRCLYAKPEMDLTTGFFMAVFQRKKRINHT